MRGLILIILMASSALFAQEKMPAELFKQQLEKSCEAKLTVIKSVEDLNTPTQGKETKSFTTSTGDSCQLEDELTHAFLLYYGEKRIKEYFDLSQAGDTTIAVLQADNKDKSSLLLQKIVFSEDGETILYVETEIQRNYWLFSSYSHIKAVFDTKGIYQNHALETETEVSLIGSGMKVRIAGERE